MEREAIIEKSIKDAQKAYPNLDSFDNPYERIADFLPMGGYENLFPEWENLSSFEFADQVESVIDSVWSRL